MMTGRKIADEMTEVTGLSRELRRVATTLVWRGCKRGADTPVRVPAAPQRPKGIDGVRCTGHGERWFD
ncbi:MAG: hypothetical protein WBV36_14485 [Terriglobales bacterium]